MVPPMKPSMAPAHKPNTHLSQAAIVFFTVTEVAELLEVSPRTVRRWIEQKELVSHKFRAARRIAKGDLRAFIARHRDL
jgi:excisionase family DNA binding protein